MEKEIINKNTNKAALEVLIGTTVSIGGFTILALSNSIPEIYNSYKYTTQMIGFGIGLGGIGSTLKGVLNYSKLFYELYEENISLKNIIKKE